MHVRLVLIALLMVVVGACAVPQDRGGQAAPAPTTTTTAAPATTADADAGAAERAQAPRPPGIQPRPAASRPRRFG